MKYIGLVFVAIVGFGCSHTVYIPNTPHQVPVVAKKRWGGQIGVDLSSAAAVPIFADITMNPPMRAQGEVGTVGGAGSSIVAALGLFEPLDLYLTHGFGLRWQFLGLAEAQSWKGTVFAGQISGRTSETSLATSGNTQHKTSTRISGTEFGASMGYQRSADLLFYTTLAHRRGVGQTDIVQPTITHKFEDTYQLTTWVIGLEFGQKWYFNAEVGGSSVAWQNAPSGTVLASSLGFGYRW